MLRCWAGLVLAAAVVLVLKLSLSRVQQLGVKLAPLWEHQVSGLLSTPMVARQFHHFHAPYPNNIRRLACQNRHWQAESLQQPGDRDECVRLYHYHHNPLPLPSPLQWHPLHGPMESLNTHIDTLATALCALCSAPSGKRLEQSYLHHRSHSNLSGVSPTAISYSLVFQW
jgi:hypothetical protein